MSTRSGVSETLKTAAKSPKSQRQIYLAALNSILSRAFTALDSRYTPRPDRMSWARIAVGALGVGATLTRDEDLDQLMDRIRKLEENLKMSSSNF